MGLIEVFFFANGPHSDKLNRSDMQWAVVSPHEGVAQECTTCQKVAPDIAYFKHVSLDARVLCKHCFV